MLIKGLMCNLSLVKENRSWLIVWAVTLAAGLCRDVVVHSLASQSSDCCTPFHAGRHLWTMAAFREHELATTTIDGIIHFVFLSAQNYASFEAFYTVILTDAAAFQYDWADKPGWWISTALSFIRRDFEDGRTVLIFRTFKNRSAF